MNLTNVYTTTNLFNLIHSDIANDMLSHAYLLYGNDEELLKEYSYCVAKHIMCTSATKPCNMCPNCIKINAKTHSDLLVYPKDNKQIKVEDANNIVLQSYVVAFEADYKVFVLHNFDTTTVAAQNKLLKTLEEPSKNVVFIINTTSISSVLATIKSRCKNVYVQDLPTGDLNEIILNNISGVSKDKLKQMLSFEPKNLSEALQIVTQNKTLFDKSIVTDMFLNMKNSSYVLKYSSKIVTQDPQLIDFFSEVLQVLASVIKLQSHIDMSSVVNYDKLQELSKLFNLAGLNELVISVNSVLQEFLTNTNKVNSLENFLFKVLEVKHKCSTALQ